MLAESSNLTDEPALPRKRRVPRRIDDGAPAHQFHTPRDFYCQIYFEVLDLVTVGISRRFDQSDLTVVADMERLLLEFANGFDCPISESVRNI